MEELVRDLSNLLLELVKMVNALWGVYATITIALLGWIFGSKRQWVWQQRLAISITFCAVATINCLSQLRFNALVAAAHSDLKTSVRSSSELPALAKAIERICLLPSWSLVLIYVLVAAGVIYLTWNQRRFHAAQGHGDDEEA